MLAHHLHLTDTAFNAIVSGKKTIESRLYDKKRRLINIGDTIKFTNRKNPSETISVKVVNLLHFDSFYELFSNNNLSKFDDKSIEGLLNQVNEFYSTEDQKRHGVVGIELLPEH